MKRKEQWNGCEWIRSERNGTLSRTFTPFCELKSVLRQLRAI